MHSHLILFHTPKNNASNPVIRGKIIAEQYKIYYGQVTDYYNNSSDGYSTSNYYRTPFKKIKIINSGRKTK